MSTDVRNEVRDFVQPKFSGEQLDDGQDIFATGFVNSLFAMELVMFLERLLGVPIPNEELNLDNFRSVDSMTALAGRLSKALA